MPTRRSGMNRGRPRTYRRKKKNYRVPQSKVRRKTRRSHKRMRRRKTRKRKNTPLEEIILKVITPYVAPSQSMNPQATFQLKSAQQQIPGLSKAYQLSRQMVKEFKKGNIQSALSLLALTQAVAGSCVMHPNINEHRFCPKEEVGGSAFLTLRPDDVLRYYPGLLDPN